MDSKKNNNLLILATCFIFIAFSFSEAGAANIATAGQDDGYSGRILEKITKKWKPPHPLGKYRLNIVLAVEGDGNLADCKVQKSSGFEALDVSACAAARAAAPFGSPPYGMPASIFFSFWSDNDSTPRTKPDPQAPDAYLAMQERAASIAANERAQAAAELAAKKTGKKMPLPGKNSKELKAPLVAQADAPPPPAHAKSGTKKAQPKNTALKTEKTDEKSQERQGEEASARSSEHAAQEQKQEASGSLGPANYETPAGVDENRYAKYISRLRWDLRNKMYIPKETSPGTYQALVEIKCNKAGRILSANMLKGSGDAILDRYVMQGIKRAGKVVAPPAGFGNAFKIDFTLVRD